MTRSGVDYKHADWPGVACQWAGFRVVAVASFSDGRPSYALQSLDVSAPERPFWCLVSGSFSRSLRDLLRKCADVEGLAAACEGVPDKPFDFAPDLFPGWTGQTVADQMRASLRAGYDDLGL